MTTVHVADTFSWKARAHVGTWRAVDEREAAYTLYPTRTRLMEKAGLLCKGEHGGLQRTARLGRLLADRPATRHLVPHITGADLARLGADLVGEAEAEGNLLVNAGINRLGSLLIAGGGQAYDSTHSALGVGDTATAASASQTDLQATVNASNRYVQVVDSAPTFSAQVLAMVATFGTGSANFAWAEWAIGQNTASGANAITSPMLNRKVASLITKTSSVAATLSVSITIS